MTMAARKKKGLLPHGKDIQGALLTRNLYAILPSIHYRRYPSHLFFRHKSESPIGPAGTERERDLSLVQRMRDKMHWELRISPSVRRSEIFPIEKHPPSQPSRRRVVGGNGARSGAGFTRGRESFAKTFPLINLVYRWAGSGDACALRSRQNFKYEQLSKFTRDVCRLRAPARLRASRDSAPADVVWPTSIIGKKRDGSRRRGE